MTTKSKHIIITKSSLKVYYNSPLTETICVGKVVHVILFTYIFVSFWGFGVCLRMQLLLTCIFLFFTGNAPLIFCSELTFFLINPMIKHIYIFS